MYPACASAYCRKDNFSGFFDVDLITFNGDGGRPLYGEIRALDAVENVIEQCPRERTIRRQVTHPCPMHGRRGQQKTLPMFLANEPIIRLGLRRIHDPKLRQIRRRLYAPSSIHHLNHHWLPTSHNAIAFITPTNNLTVLSNNTLRSHEIIKHQGGNCPFPSFRIRLILISVSYRRCPLYFIAYRVYLFRQTEEFLSQLPDCALVIFRKPTCAIVTSIFVCRQPFR